jgi:hypothetical protein
MAKGNIDCRGAIKKAVAFANRAAARSMFYQSQRAPSSTTRQTDAALINMRSTQMAAAMAGEAAGTYDASRASIT